MSIHSSKENIFLRSLITASSAWTGGLSKLSWSDGSAWEFDNWEAGQPDGQGCVVYGGQTTEWRIQSCGDQMDFVCRKLCPMGWTMHEENCYQYVDQPESWDRARAECLSYQVSREVSQRY